MNIQEYIIISTTFHKVILQRPGNLLFTKLDRVLLDNEAWSIEHGTHQLDTVDQLGLVGAVCEI